MDNEDSEELRIVESVGEDDKESNGTPPGFIEAGSIPLQDMLYPTTENQAKIQRSYMFARFKNLFPVITMRSPIDFLGLPVGAKQVETLIEYSLLEPVDPNRLDRKPWVIKPENFIISGEGWKESVQEAVNLYIKQIFPDYKRVPADIDIFDISQPQIVIHVPLTKYNNLDLDPLPQTHSFLIIHVCSCLMAMMMAV